MAGLLASLALALWAGSVHAARSDAVVESAGLMHAASSGPAPLLSAWLPSQPATVAFKPREARSAAISVPAGLPPEWGLACLVGLVLALARLANRRAAAGAFWTRSSRGPPLGVAA